MAKAPKSQTPAATPAPAASAPAAPAQPWAPKPAAVAESAAPAPAPAPTPVPVAANAESAAPVVPADKLASEQHDQLTPSGPAPAEVIEQARDESAGNGGSTDTTVASEAHDQLTPTGPSPAQVDAEAETLTPDNAPERVSSEAKDQVTESGDDISSKLYAQMRDLDDEELADFEAAMRETATKKLEQIRRNREAKLLEMNMVDSQQHYGKRAEAAKNGGELT